MGGLEHKPTGSNMFADFEKGQANLTPLNKSSSMKFEGTLFSGTQNKSGLGMSFERETKHGRSHSQLLEGGRDSNHSVATNSINQ